MAGDSRVLLANSIYHLTNDGAVMVMAGQITVLQATFGFGPFETGLLSGVALLITAVFQFVVGVVSDRRGPSRFVAISRIGAAFYHPVGIAWIGREFRGGALDRSMGFQSAFGDTGVILGMASGAVVAVAAGWGSPFLLWGGINLAAVALGLLLVRGRPSPPAATEERADFRGRIRDGGLGGFPRARGGGGGNGGGTVGPPP